VLDPGRGKTKTGYFWAMARDDWPWGGTDPPAVVYSYAPGRGGEHAQASFASYRGIVQCDGYAVYKTLPRNRIQLAFCWAHYPEQSFIWRISAGVLGIIRIRRCRTRDKVRAGGAILEARGARCRFRCTRRRPPRFTSRTGSGAGRDCRTVHCTLTAAVRSAATGAMHA
jgi:hypothetical protein